MVKYDVIYYWVGGSEYGKWHATLGYSEEMLDSVRRQGYIAYPGLLSIGMPKRPPTITIKPLR